MSQGLKLREGGGRFGLFVLAYDTVAYHMNLHWDHGSEVLRCPSTGVRVDFFF